MDTKQKPYFTGSAAGDFAAGLAGTLVSPLFFCAGGMAPVLLYFRYRERYPAAGRGMALGIVLLAILLLLSPGILMWMARHVRSGPFKPGA